ncbi:hypothetical protein JAAARDRAFT_119364 [Jaapia argillacea MUCL 33604]|uniref:NAD(P)-binding protein n=1 Tax=Jaapia argillacea MUCL 33604 TaxID=933084 RepID=A0A067Q938_9AGAM|nr:hypothetical protein JAAARDRAFT_119364 [Jaapia argillacea MUCL 33604]
MLWRLFHWSKIQRYNHPGQRGVEPWALVTGASDGIGKGVALELLSQGFNVIIHGRNLTKLQRVREQLNEQHPTRSVEIFVWDATQPISRGGKNLSEAVLASVGSKHLTVLVNNVGFTSTYHTFASQDPEEIDAVVTLQISFVTHITRALLPELAKNEPGLIINVGGLTGLFPSPFLAVHSGGKAYLAGFSRALSIELELVREPPTDIECLHVDIHNVATNSNGSDAGFLTPTPETMGRAIIGVVGCGRRSVTAYWRAEATELILKLLPRSMMDGIMAKEMMKMRDRELQRAAAKRDD